MDSEGYEPFSYATEPSLKKRKPNAIANVFNNVLRDDARPSKDSNEINIDFSVSIVLALFFFNFFYYPFISGTGANEMILVMFHLLDANYLSGK